MEYCELIKDAIKFIIDIANKWTQINGKETSQTWFFFLSTIYKQSKLVEQNIKIEDAFEIIIICRMKYSLGNYLKNIRTKFQNELEKYLKIDLNKHSSDDPKLKLDLIFIPSHFNLTLHIQNFLENVKKIINQNLLY
jgi:hypothetical protein